MNHAEFKTVFKRILERWGEKSYPDSVVQKLFANISDFSFQEFSRAVDEILFSFKTPPTGLELIEILKSIHKSYYKKKSPINDFKACKLCNFDGYHFVRNAARNEGIAACTCPLGVFYNRAPKYNLPTLEQALNQGYVEVQNDFKVCTQFRVENFPPHIEAICLMCEDGRTENHHEKIFKYALILNDLDEKTMFDIWGEWRLGKIHDEAERRRNMTIFSKIVK